MCVCQTILIRVIMNYRNFIAGILVVIFSFYFAPKVLAHGTEPRLEIDVERLNPGGVIVVRGVDFEFEELISLSLIGQDVEISLGDITVDTEGVFTQIITLPVDLSEGFYNFRATTDDHEILSPQLTVWGSAVVEGDEQRTDEDTLLAPMPTIPVSDSISAPPPASEQLDTSSSNNLWLITAFIALGVRGVVMFIVRKAMVKG